MNIWSGLCLDRITRKLGDLSKALEAYQNMKKKNVWNRIRKVLSAEDHKEALAAIWEGINRAHAVYQVLHIAYYHHTKGLSSEYLDGDTK